MKKDEPCDGECNHDFCEGKRPDEEVCEFCGGSGTITRDYHDPGDYYGHGQTEEICICRIGDEDADMDDDS